MKIKTHREPLTTFNTISLTDIIFLLLVFFLLSSTFVLQPGIKVQLPTTSSADVSSEKSIVITVAKDRTVYLNDSQINKIELGALLRQKLLDVGNPIVVLRADKDVTFEGLVEVMDISKTAGADRFVIATAQKE
ncbi:ExbD/TolR family protein [Candidatus Latescibacterota bacterium]